MQLLKTDPEVAPYALRTMTQVAGAAGNGLGKPQHALLDAAQQVVLETSLEIEGLAPIEPAAISRHLRDPAQARQLIRMLVMISLAEGPPSPKQFALISSFAAALGVDEPSVGVIRHLAEGRIRRFRLAFLRRSHIRQYLRNTRRMLGGSWPTMRALLVARGVVGENKLLSERMRALAELPAETLGHQFFQHCTTEGLAFAGQKGGFPVGALFHDFSHVLAGYDTSPEGELKNAAFQTGFTRHEDAFFTLLFAIVIHTAGINLAPFPMPVLLGRIGQGNLAVEVYRAWDRGSAMPVDLGDDWDFWSFVELPIDEARKRLGIPPLLN